MTGTTVESLEASGTAWQRVSGYVLQRFPLARSESSSALRFVAVVAMVSSSRALAIDLHALVLRCLVDDEVELAATLDLFIREAATLRSHLFVPPSAPDLFAHFVD